MKSPLSPLHGRPRGSSVTVRTLGVLAALATLTCASLAQTPTPFRWTTFAGQPGGFGSADGVGPAARLNKPIGVAVDSTGNLYVADTNNSTIRKVTSAGVVTTLAGAPLQEGSADGAGSSARFKNPRGVAVDASGNVYVADTGNHTIRKVTAAGVVTTLAGSSGTPGVDNGEGTADGTGAAARFRAPSALVVGSGGVLYVADLAGETIRRVTATGVVTTLAGSPGVIGSADGQGETARFFNPTGLAVDATGNLYVADSGNQSIRKVTTAGVVTTVAGRAGQFGNPFLNPTGVAVDATGNLYVSDELNRISKVTSAGVVTTLAGSGLNSSNDGLGRAAGFSAPAGVALDTSGNLYVADTQNNTIRKVTPAGLVTTLAGSAGGLGSSDGIGRAARFFFPTGVAADASGTVYVSDSNNQTIRKATSVGVVTTLAGAVGQIGFANGTGAAARFTNPNGLAVDGSGNVYVADSGNTEIRKVTPAGVVTTLAGSPPPDGGDNSQGATPGGDPAGAPGDGTGGAATFLSALAVASDAGGTVYVADSSTIRKVTAAGVVTTLAGASGATGSVDGSGATARFAGAVSLALGAGGHLYVVDQPNHTIRKVTLAGVVTTFAGSPGQAGSADGTGAAARFNFPTSVAADASGNLYVLDGLNVTVRKITPAGVVTTIGGTPGLSGAADGTGAAVRFLTPFGLGVTGDGIVYVADSGNNRLVRGLQLTAPAAPLYPNNPVAYTLGVSITPNVPAPTSLKTAPTSFAIAPALPAGVVFNTATGAITGTPTALAASRSYIVTARNDAGSSPGANLTLGVNAAAPTSITYPTSTAIYFTSQPIAIQAPVLTGGGPVSYTVSPALPAGLSLNPVTGVISGTPSVTSRPGDYVVTARNTGGSAQTTLRITILSGEPALAGRYSLLLANPGGPRAALVLTLSAGLRVTGAVHRNDYSRLVVRTGVLAANGTTTATLADGSLITLAFNGRGRVAAALTTAGGVLSGEGAISSEGVPAASPGLYSLAFNAGGVGVGNSLLYLGSRGDLLIAGRLPDGSPFLGNQGLLLDRDGYAPLFLIGARAAKPLLTGTLRFGGVPEVSGELRFNANGVDRPCEAIGAKWWPF